MELIFHPTTGKQFSLRMGQFDTVLQIKKRIQKKQGIPVSTQTLVFGGGFLDDEIKLIESDLTSGSHIQLIIKPDNVLDHTQTLDQPNPAKHINNTEKSSPISKRNQLPIKKRWHNPEKHGIASTHEESSTHFKKIILPFKMPSSDSSFTLEMETNDTIGSVKQRLQAMEGNANMSQFVLHANGIELHDDETINDSALHLLSETAISIGPLSTYKDLTGPSRDVTGSAKKLRVSVSISGFKSISLVVNPDDELAELRNELENLNQDSDLDLPPRFFFKNNYVFLHNGSVMKEDRSFRWNCVNEDFAEIVYFPETTESSES